MNWIEVSMVGAALVFPDARERPGWRPENSRPLPGAINFASDGDCRTRLPLFFTQTALFVRLLKAGTCTQQLCCLSGAAAHTFSVPGPGDPPQICRAFGSHPGLQMHRCLEGLRSASLEQRSTVQK